MKDEVAKKIQQEVAKMNKRQRKEAMPNLMSKPTREKALRIKKSRAKRLAFYEIYGEFASRLLFHSERGERIQEWEAKFISNCLSDFDEVQLCSTMELQAIAEEVHSQLSLL